MGTTAKKYEGGDKITENQYTRTVEEVESFIAQVEIDTKSVAAFGREILLIYDENVKAFR